MYHFRIQSKKSEELALILIEEVRNKHYQLCDHCTTLNNLYSFQILIIILQDTVTIVFSLYYIGRYSIERVQLSLAFKIYIVVIIILALSRIIGLTICCSSTIAEVRFYGVTYTFLDRTIFQGKTYGSSRTQVNELKCKRNKNI